MKKLRILDKKSRPFPGGTTVGSLQYMTEESYNTHINLCSNSCKNYSNNIKDKKKKNMKIKTGASPPC